MIKLQIEVNNKKEAELLKNVVDLMNNYKTIHIESMLKFTRSRIDLLNMSKLELLNNYYPKRVPKEIKDLAESFDNGYPPQDVLNLRKLHKYLNKAVENYEENVFH